MLEEVHSSIQKDVSVSQYIADDCKYYYLPLFDDTLVNPLIAKAVGCVNEVERSHSEIESSVIKAKKAHYSHIKIPFDRVDHPSYSYLHKKADQYGLKMVYQVFTSFLYDDEFFQGLLNRSKNIEIEWVFDSTHEKLIERIEVFRKQKITQHFTIPVHRNLDWSQIFSSGLFGLFKDIHLYFSYQLNEDSNFLSCKEAYKLVGQLREKFIANKFLPPKGVDIWDQRARADFDMEPYVLPCFETQSVQPSVKYSVIIPTFNNQNHLRVVLRHLYRQNVGLDNFEVIVVDDGGTDQTQALVMELLNSFPESINFKYIFFKRVRQRVMGDSQYRAGISRNLGVKNAVGEYLCFLDSDIIVPEDYLFRVSEALKDWDAIQAKRINLSQAASNLKFEYDEMNPEKDLIPDEPYWEEFIQQKDWHLIPYNWKYVCTHSFSMKRDLFWKIGGLKKNFIFYGFEDTDLGYRLVKGGYRLHLLDVKVLHMFHENTRSEFMNLKSLRHSLLSRTAQIFYLHNLDEDIFNNLLGFMEPEPTFQRFANKMARALSLQFIWKAKDPVYKSLDWVRGEK